ASSSGCCANTARDAAVFAPGQMALATMPYGAHSRAAVRVRARRASLALLYSAVPMWAFTVQRAQVDDAAVPLGLHQRERGLHGPEGTVEADVETVVEQLIGLVLDATEAAATPRVVHEDVDGAPLVARRVDHAEHIVLAGDVHPQEPRRLAELGRGVAPL